METSAGLQVVYSRQEDRTDNFLNTGLALHNLHMNLEGLSLSIHETKNSAINLRSKYVTVIEEQIS